MQTSTIPIMSISNSRFGLSFFPEGVLVMSGSPGSGIPLDAMAEITKILPKNAVLDPGIAGFYAATSHPRTIFASTTPELRQQWRARIKETLALIQDPEERWVKGLDVGSSSVSIFSVLASGPWRGHFNGRANAAIPRDQDDFARCQKLLADFPGWKDRLPEVAAAYPDTAWPVIIENWDRLESMSASEIYDFLRPLK